MKLKNKHKPTCWQELMVPRTPGVRALIDRLFTTGQCSSSGLLLYDTFADGGSGKSTLIKEFIKVSGWEVIALDSAGETKSALDRLKNQFRSVESYLGNFGNPNPAFGAPKIIVTGHEISKSSKDFIDGLRDIMDDWDELALFLFTDNDFAKLSTNNPQVFRQQRVVSLDWDQVHHDDIRAYCYNILKVENMDTESNRKIVDALISINRASIRGTIIGMENNCK